MSGPAELPGTPGPLPCVEIWFWRRPAGAYGLPFAEDARLVAIGIARVLADHERRVVIYQGARPLDVHRSAKREGYSLEGWSLDWVGPDPTGRPQLVLPLGVVLDNGGAS